MLFFVYIIINREQEAIWRPEDVYGNWKVTRLIGAYKSTKGDLSYGTNIGRSFSITDESIIDSTGLQDAVEEADEQRCYSMKVLKQEEHIIDISKQENIKKFQLKNGIILSYAGIEDNIISQYVFYSDNGEFNDDYHMAPELEVFSYSQNDKDKLIVSLPMGFYLLERFKEQKKVENPYGFWMIESLISKGNSKKKGIEFFDYYGQCFEIAEEYVEYYGKIEMEIKWEKDLISKVDYERKYQIKEGLGLENDELEIWCGTGKNNFTLQLIPVTYDEIIVLWENQWFLVSRLPQYEEPAENIEAILNGNWKIVQLLGMGYVDETMEICGREDYKAWWYTQSVTFDQTLYAENAVTDWEILTCTALEFDEKFDVPENITYLFKENDMLHLGIREVRGMEEIYIVLDKDTLFRGRNGLWYELKRVST